MSIEGVGIFEQMFSITEGSKPQKVMGTKPGVQGVRP